MANIELFGRPEETGGLGDPQVMHMLMLLARTGRRISEIVMLDRDPLLPLNRPTPAPEDEGAYVAKLRYQQTKIDKAPDTILVDSEIVAIIRAQQQRVDEHRAADWFPGTRPRYVFLARKLNRRADRPLTVEVVRDKLPEFVARLDIRDEAGRLVDFNRTHRFRHTKATRLLNAGVPLHVIQRYFDHMSPTMLMTRRPSSRPTSGSSCATGRSPLMPGNCPPIPATSTTCWSSICAPNASCPTDCVCCRPVRPARKGTPA
ncbi:tyrosine-type recombinase/integrase [Streptomyces sp. NBC_01727]|uniref:tyrosine-type recombinase/integrase n=1 Tax=Streptomyces sp. NBC_01727 TaxID=2975924 RepID=UPI003FA39B39